LGEWRVFVVGADGNGLTRLGEDDVVGREPVWSPDGSRIAYEAWINGKWAIWSMAADGTGPRDLSRDPGAATVLGSSGPRSRRPHRVFADRGLPSSSQPSHAGPCRQMSSGDLVAIVAVSGLRRRAIRCLRRGHGLGHAAGGDPDQQWRCAGGGRRRPVVDVLVRSAAPGRKRRRGAAPRQQLRAAGRRRGGHDGLGWTPTLLLGVAIASALGWGLPP
jgi:hypothetical protein